jgi:hypothetical protein
MEIPLV